MYVSPYQISTFLECPQKYRFQYIDGLGEVFGRPRPYFYFGNAIHRALRDFYHLGGPSKNPFPFLYKLYRSQWEGLDPVKEGYRDRDEAEEYYYRGYYMLKNYYQEHEREEVETLHIEEHFKEEILSGITLGGRIDRIAKTPDGHLEIIDYKTGKWVPKEEELRSDIQPAIYYYLVKKRFNPQHVRIKNYYLFKKKTIYLEEVSLGEEELKELIYEMREEIHRGLFPWKTHRFCSYCDFLPLCPPKIKVQEAMGPRMRSRVMELARDPVYDSPLLSLRALLLALEEEELEEGEELLENLEGREEELSKEQLFLYLLKKTELYLKQKRRDKAREVLKEIQAMQEGVDLPDYTYLLEWMQISLENG